MTPMNVLSAARSYRAGVCATSAAVAAITMAALMHLLTLTDLLESDDPTPGIGAMCAERFFGQKRSGSSVGSCATAPATRVVTALAAFPLQRVGIAQILEHQRLVPDVLEALDSRVAGTDRQIAARVDPAFVRDEADARASQAAARHRRQMLTGWMSGARG